MNRPEYRNILSKATTGAARVVYLRRHTPAYVTAGIGLGILAFVSALLLSSSPQTPDIFVR